MTNYVLGTVDAGGDGKEVLLANVNALHNTNYTLDQFDFGDPQVITISLPNRNTRIGLSPKAATGYYGTKWIYYNRIHVTELGVISVARGAATRVVDLLEQINQKYGILITPADIYDAALPPAVPGEDTVSVALDFRETSIIYYGGTFIQLGNNDPSVPGTTPQTPFAHDVTLLLASPSQDKTILTGLSFDTDHSRKRSSTFQAQGNDLELKDLMRIGLTGETTSAPIFTWSNTAGAVRALLNTTEVIELDKTTNTWSIVGQLHPGDLNDPTVYAAVMTTHKVLGAAQGDDGKLAAVFAESVLVSEDNGNTWTELTLSTSTDSRLFGNSWTALIAVSDAIIRNNKLHLLVMDDAPYQGGTGKARGVEVADLATGAVAVHKLSEMTHMNGQSAIMDLSLLSSWSFMTPQSAGATLPCVVAAYNESGWPSLVCFNPNNAGSDYELHSVPVPYHAGPFSALSHERGLYVHAYEVPLAKNSHVLEVIEWSTLVRSPEIVPVVVLNHELKSEEDWFSFGVRTFTRLRSTSGERTAWVDSILKLPGFHVPQQLSVIGQGKRVHLHAQRGKGLYKINYEESSTGAFTPILAAPYEVQASSLIHGVPKYAAGPFHATTVAESSFTGYSFAAFVNNEVTKALIEYSFVTKDVNGEDRWLVAPPGGTTLTQRTVSLIYGDMDVRPTAVFAQGGDLYYVSGQKYAVHKSANAGRAWTRYASVGYEAWAPMHYNNLAFGSAVDSQVNMKSTAFKAGSFTPDAYIVQLKAAGTVRMVDTKGGEIDHPVTYNNDFLLKIIAANGDHLSYVDEVTQEGGVNIFSNTTPTRLLAWDLKPAQNYPVIYADYTETVGDELAERADTLGFAHASIPAAFIPIAAWDDLGYVNLNAVSVGYVPNGGNPIYSIYETDAADAVTQVQLFGGSGPFSAFRPEVGFMLWDYIEGDNYVPLVLYGNKRVMVLNRLDEAGEHSWTNVAVTVPGDNGQPIVPVPMLNENRREYLLSQKGNGIFKITYAYAPLTKVTTIALQKLFDLTATAFSTMDVITGACVSKPAVTMPQTAITPTFPPDGTLLSWACQGFDKIGTYADGSGGTYDQLIEANSADCGYVAPPPTGVGADSAEIVLNNDAGEAVETDTLADEGGNAYVVWSLAEALNADAVFTIGINYDTAGAPDISAVHYQVGYTGGWTAMSFPQEVTLPAGETVLCLRVAHTQDSTTEGAETYFVTLTKVSSNVTNTTPIVTQITISDTSTAPIGAASTTMSLDETTGNAFDTVLNVNEGDYIQAVFKLTEALNADADVDVGLNVRGIPVSGDLSFDDIEVGEYRFGYTGSWIDANGSTMYITIPAGETVLCTRWKVKKDGSNEGTESVTIYLMPDNSSQITSGLIETPPVVVADTSNSTSQVYVVEYAPGMAPGPDQTNRTTNEGGKATVMSRLSRSFPNDDVYLRMEPALTNIDPSGIVGYELKRGENGAWVPFDPATQEILFDAGLTVFGVRVEIAAEAVTEQASIHFNWYRGTSDTVLEEYDNTATVIIVINSNSTGGGDETVVLMTTNAAPFIQAYRWSDTDGFGSPTYRYAAPADPLDTRTGGVAINTAGDTVFAVTLAGDPTLWAYEWSYSGGFGTRYMGSVGAHNPSGGGVEAISVHPDDTAVFLTFNENNKPGAVMWTPGVGFDATVQVPPDFNANGIPGCHQVPSADGQVVFMGGETTGTFIPRLYAWQWTPGTGYGTAYAPVTTDETVKHIVQTPSGEAVIVALGGGNLIAAYPWNNATGFGAAYAAPAELVTVSDPWNNTCIAIHPAGNAVAIAPGAADGGTLTVYQWDDATGFGTRYPTVAITGLGTSISSITWTPDGGAIIVSHGKGRGYTAYHWDDVTGIGAEYAQADDTGAWTASIYDPVRELITK